MSQPQAATNFGSLTVRPPHIAAGQRIGLLGGSFNPPHEGHLNLSLMALKTLELDRIWWLVTPGNPIKSHDGLGTLKDRLKACEKISSHPRIDVTAFEAALPTNYTADTLRFLKLRFKAVDFVWLMGADNLVHFHKWQEWRTVFQTMPIAVFDRPGYRFKALSSPAAHSFRASRITNKSAKLLVHQAPPAWQFITMPLSHLSSTDLRKGY